MDNNGDKTMTQEKYKIFEASSLKQTIKDCLDAGYFPPSYEELYKLKQQGKWQHSWYNTSTLFYKGKISKATKKQLKNIEQIYKDGGRLSVFGDSGDLNGVNNLVYYDARVLGVRVLKKEMKK